ncbi:MAG: site-specific integrase, partial [Candidatus Methanomethylophilaceae archaeon]|nr:site-specific integrase [Candidatus Methanomethylophilaceae archaeon]
RLSDNTLRLLRQKAENDLDIRYDGRKCRRSYGQYLKDHGVDIECISSLMGHNNTDTTEDYYARISPDMAILQTMEKLVD